MKPIIRTREVLEQRNNWLSAYFDEVRFPDGSTGRYNRIVVGEGGSATGVIIVPFIAPNRVILVKQFRYPISEFLLSFPRGFGKANVPTLVTAQNELEEETRYRAKQLTKVGEVYLDPGLLTAKAAVYAASELVQLGPGECDENIELHEYDVPELTEMIRNGAFIDGPSLAALGLLLIRGNISLVAP